MSTWNSIMRSQNQGSLGLDDAWLVLQTLPGMTPERLNRLTDAFPIPAEVFEAPPDVFARLCGRKAREVLDKDSPLDLASKIRQEASKIGAGIITRDSAQYPESLHEIYAPPGAFFIEGEILAADRLAVAIVGMRRPTDYGRRVARQLAADLARKGVTIVSGMAYGIDAEAHRATLDAGGRTIAVLGCGLTQNYPADHKELRGEIAAHGAVDIRIPPSGSSEKREFPEEKPPHQRLVSGDGRSRGRAAKRRPPDRPPGARTRTRGDGRTGARSYPEKHRLPSSDKRRGAPGRKRGRHRQRPSRIRPKYAR